ncbi:MAG TPA: haloacid dehalogenase type II [Polyangiaceae bacterium LLY-WYZ-14_1]|nr:haloacid dehalogenase type II [Polyangiaceae bacterium LLY-WYZ-14_1]
MAAHSELRNVRACVFDAYGTLFDFHSAVARHREEIGPKADALSAVWRQKQLEYTWLRALMRRHAPFREVTAEALDYAIEAVGLPRGDEVQETLMQAYLRLAAYPEVGEVMGRLRASRLKTAILSNGTPDMLGAAIESAGLAGTLDAVLSVEAVGVFKPDPRVYQLAVDELAVTPDRILFLSSNAWDVAGAAHFGFRVGWVNRSAAPAERLPGRATVETRDLAGLPDLLGLDDD